MPAQSAWRRLAGAAGLQVQRTRHRLEPMRNRRHPSNNVERLRLAIDCMPVGTREAMLAGVGASERIIAGAYVDRDGGVCPMLAAHREGARTEGLAFARSWDRFTRAAGKPRIASDREVQILVRQLQSSLESPSSVDLGAAITDHRKLVLRGRRARRALVQALDPTGEIVARRLSERRARRAGLRAARRCSSYDGPPVRRGLSLPR